MQKASPGDIGLVVIRLAGLMLAWHGYKKATATDEGFAKFVEGVAYLGFPRPQLFAWAAVIAELGGGLLIGLGIYTRIAAAFAAFTMGVAAFVRHADDSFDVKEKALLYLVICVGLMLTGGGGLTVDSTWRNRKRKKG